MSIQLFTSGRSSSLAKEAMPLYDMLAEILRYPTAKLAQHAAAWAMRAQQSHPDAARKLQEFGAFAEARTQSELEEQYTRTFDFNPTASLEVGYQLFGESYKRGAFLTKMKAAARSCGLEGGTELWDYLPKTLEVIARLESQDDPRGLVDEAVLPATSRMLEELGESPYKGLVEAAQMILKRDFAIREIQAAPPRDPKDFPDPDEMWSTKPGADACGRAMPGFRQEQQ